MKQWNFRATARCLLCTEYEDNTHVLTCMSLAAIETWEALMDLLELKLVSMHSPNELTGVILLALNSWRNNTTFTFVTDDVILRTAVGSQTALGWLLFLEGCHVTQWVNYVATFMPHQKCPSK